MGNKINEHAIWTPIIDKIDATIQQWEKTHPTIEGRRTIIQCTIGSMTQYLTVAQGMPPDIKKTLVDRSREFIWDNSKKPSISMDILHTPIAEGGKKLLHLKSRNEAIKLMWLKSLLSPEEHCPQWAHFAHALIAKYTAPNPVVHPNAWNNMFLQTWKPVIRKLPPPLQRIIKTARKYRTKWEANLIPPDITQKLPIWFHIGAMPELSKWNNHYYTTCLHDRHNIRNIGDLQAITS